MKIIYIQIISYWVVFGINSYGQLSTSGTINNYMVLESRFSSPGLNATGSPYITDAKNPGYVVFRNDFRVENGIMRYNAYQNLLELRSQNADYIVKSSDIKEFGYTDPKSKSVLVYKYLALEDGSKNIVQVIFEDGIIFGIYTSIKIRYGASNGLNPGKDELQSIKSYYLIRDGQATKFTRNNKSFIEVLPDHNTELEEFLKKEKLNVKNDPDIIKALTYYNSFK